MAPPARVLRLALAALLALACTSREADLELPPVPEELREPRVVSSRLGLEGLFVLEPRVGKVTEVARLPDGSLALSGTHAALRIRGPGDVTRVSFPKDSAAVPWDVVRTDLEGDGVEELLNRGGNWHPVWVRDAASGRERWRSDWGANVLRAADLDGDGRLDLLLGMSGDDGIHRLDANGAVVWSAEASNVRQIEAAELDPHSPGLEIVHSVACGKLVIRSAAGRILRELPPPVCASHFALLSDAQGEPVIWMAKDRALHRLQLRDGQHREVALPVPIGWGEPLAARVRLAEQDYEAVLLDDRIHDRAILTLVGEEGALAHIQVLDSSCVFVAPWREPQSETLVLGCGRRVFVFGPPIDAWSTSLAIRGLVFGAASAELLEDRIQLAGALREANRLSAAEAQLADARRAAEALPEGHAGRAMLANAWALVLEEEGDTKRADAKLAEALQLLERSSAADPQLRSDVHHNLARAAQRERDWRAAEQHYRRSLALLEDGRPPGADVAGAAHGLAQVLLEQGRSDEAVAWAELALRGDLRSFGPDHPDVALDRALVERIKAARGGPRSPARSDLDLR